MLNVLGGSQCSYGFKYNNVLQKALTVECMQREVQVLKEHLLPSCRLWKYEVPEISGVVGST